MSNEIAPRMSSDEFDRKYGGPEDYDTLKGYGPDLLSHRASPESDLSLEQIRDLMATPLGAMVIEQAKREHDYDKETDTLHEEAHTIQSSEMFESSTEESLAETIIDDPNQPFLSPQETQEITDFTEEQRQTYKLAYDIVVKKMTEQIKDLKQEDPENWDANVALTKEISAKLAILFSHRPNMVFGRESGRDSFDDGKTFRDELYRVFSQAPQPNNSNLRYSYNGRYVSGRAEYAFQDWINAINKELAGALNSETQKQKVA